MYDVETWLTILGAGMIAFGSSMYGSNPRERIALFCMFYGIAFIAAV